MKPKVHVVVLNWNGWGDTAACLSSLRQLHYENYEVIVVDNGSTDDSVSRIRDEFPWAYLIETGKNLGFGGGCNVGIRYSLAQRADFVWLLNSDTIVDCDALRALVDKAQSDNDTGAVGSAIYFMDEPERLQAWGGGRINFWLGHGRHFLKPVCDDKIEFITGASMLISGDAIRTIGLFDERFFMYWEDGDYCFRLRAAGFRLAVASGSKIWHKQFGSVGKESVLLDKYFNASAAHFFNKHAAVPLFPLWAGYILRLVKRVVTGDWKRTKAVWASMTEKRTVL